MEYELIHLAKGVNPNLINEKGTKPQDWSIKGVIRGGRGKPSTDEMRVRELLGIDIKQ